jgi:hypothetical protein
VSVVDSAVPKAKRINQRRYRGGAVLLALRGVPAGPHPAAGVRP